MRATFPFLIGALLAGCLTGQGASYPGKVIWGSQRYVEYIVGNAPLVLTMPHGGYLKPPSVKDRTYGVRTQDARTQETGREIAARFRDAYGLQPHLVINHLHRKKLDANREIIEAAQGDRTAERAWRDFHGFIDTARKVVVSRYGRGLLIDVHGHGHPRNWIELGYLLTAANLNQSDSKLNAATFRDKSSVRTLATSNRTATFSALIRGASSLGGLLQARGLTAVPSPGNPGPGSNAFFSGGYDTRRWGSQTGGTVDAIQIELPSSMRRDLAGRAKFTTSLVQSLDPFFAKYYRIALTSGPRVTVTAATPVGTEVGGTAAFRFARTGSLRSPLTVSILVGGSATAGLDYRALATSITIPANVNEATVLVRPTNDSLREGPETVTVTLLPGAGSSALRVGVPNAATVVLLDDESDPGLAGHWPLDEASGSSARDISGHKRTASLRPAPGGPTHIRGTLSGALSFDERDDHATIPDFDYAGGTAFTISFWFRTPRSTQSSTQYLFSHGSVLSPNSLNIYWFESTGVLRTWLRCKTDISSSNLLDVGRKFMDNAWHQYTLTVSASLDAASVYIDGVLQAANRIDGDNLDPTGNVFLGGRQDRSRTRFLRGDLDDVMIQGRHLTAAEVRELFTASAGYARRYGVGCKTSTGSTPVHRVQGAPRAGSPLVFEVAGAGSARAGALHFGFSRSRIGGATLPLDLKFLGAPSCLLQQDAALAAPIGLFLGRGTLLLRIPADPSLRGLRTYSQGLVLDGSANPAGFAVSNGVVTALGG
jgi:N-formylglutamate amidohydrolase